MRKTKSTSIQNDEPDYQHGYAHRRHRTRKSRYCIKPFVVRLYKKKKQKYSFEEQED